MRYMMKFAFLILLFTARYTWALEYREIIGEYRCDINEAPYNESNNLEKKPGVWDK